MVAGRPPKGAPEAAADAALERWLDGEPPEVEDLDDDELARVREALGESTETVDTLN